MSIFYENKYRKKTTIRPQERYFYFEPMMAHNPQKT